MLTEIKKEYSLRDDIVGTYLLADPRNNHILTHLVKTTSDRTDNELEGMIVTNGEKLVKDYVNGKSFQMDIKIRLKDESNIILEIQNNNNPETELKNVLYSMNQLIVQTKRGKGYNNVKPVLLIIIVNDAKKKNEIKKSILKSCQIRDSIDKDFIVLNDYYKVKIVDINNEIDYDSDSEDLIDWVLMFRAKNLNELKKLSKRSKICKEVYKAMGYYLKEDEFIRTFDDKLEEERMFAYEKAREEFLEVGRNEGLELGRNEGLELGRNEGLELGRNEGRLYQSFDMARIMLDKDEPIDKIIEYTGLTNEEITDLKETMSFDKDKTLTRVSNIPYRVREKNMPTYELKEDESTYMG